MTTLELIALRQLEIKIDDARKRCRENSDNERKCRDVVPFIDTDLKEAIEILYAIKNHKP